MAQYIQDNNMLKEFNRKMKTLEDNGIFTAQQRSVVPGTRYLIISYGGTGVDALFQIRRTMNRYLSKKDRDNYIRFLAIDTDKKTMDHTENIKLPDGTTKTIVTDSLEQKEFFWLDNVPSKSAVKTTPEIFKDWMNPNLPALINSSSNMLDGNGASATRQIGRLIMFPQAVSAALQHRVQTLAAELTNGTADELRVMIVTGISGGTGSGIVIDATYLIRDAISKLPGSIGKKTKYIGFVMLPPTGDRGALANIVSKGNRNGYAALKEINQFMTLSYRKERYIQQFGAIKVDSSDNIFDNCYLLDGIQLDIALNNPREFVKNVLSECVIDMITSQPVDTAGGTAPRAVDSLMSDVDTFAMGMVNSRSHTDAPRDADYIYSILGHGDVSIPVDLIKTYVAKLLFDRMYMLFRRCENVDDKDVDDFIKDVKIPSFNPRAQQQAINAGIAEAFTDYRSGKGGPFYAINLLKDASVRAEELASRVLLSKAKEDQYRFMAGYFRNQNRNYFTVYTQIMEELKNVLTKEYDLVVGGGYKGANSYTFCPISLEAGDKATAAVTTYLDGLVTNQQVMILVDNLLKTIIQNQDAWGQLLSADGKSGSFEGALEIRKFWNSEMDKIVNATVEDFLIKVYADDKNAKYDPEDPASVAALNTAAQTIYNSMFGPAGMARPTAELDVTLGLTMANFNGHVMMLVPKQAPHLIEAIKNYAAAQDGNVQIYSSEASDRISCYVQYTSIPAFKFKWAQRAEPDYEDGIGMDGLHMSETTGGNQWRDFPNLLPKSTWINLEHYENPREKKLADRAVDLFTQAKDMGLTESVPLVGAPVLQYSVKCLPADMIPGADLFKEYDVRDIPGAAPETLRDRDGYMVKIQAAAMEKAKELYSMVSAWTSADNVVADLEAEKAGLFESKELKTTQAILAVPSKPAGWDEYVATCFLRKMPDLMVSMRGTLMVIKCLEELVKRDMAIVDFTKYVVAGLFTYNDEYMEWEYPSAMGQEVLFAAEFGNKIQEVASYYFLYNAFAEKAAAISADLQPLYDAANGAGLTQRERIPMLKKMAASATAVKEQNLAKLKTAPNLADPMSVLVTTQFKKAATLKGYDSEAIIKFYQTMNDLLYSLYNV